MYIIIERRNGGYQIRDSLGHGMFFLWYTKREALRTFKEAFGWRYKHGVDVYDYSAE